MSTNTPFEGPYSPMEDPQMYSQPHARAQGSANGGPQATFSPNMGGAFHGGSYPPPRPAVGSFFDSFRSSGYFRSEPRVLGGVCAGLAARFGWDRTLVRVVIVVLTLFAPLLLALYGVAWAFLPEHRDGRIHFQSLLQGRFDVAQLGALVMVILGLGNVVPWFGVFGANGVGVMIMLTIVALAVLAVIGAVSPSPSPYDRSFPPRDTFSSPSYGMENSMDTSVQGDTPSPEPSTDWRAQGGPATSPAGGPFNDPRSSGPSVVPPHAAQAGAPSTPYATPYTTPHPYVGPPSGTPSAGGPQVSAASPYAPAQSHAPYASGAMPPYASGPVPPPVFGVSPAAMTTQARWTPGPALKPRVLPAWANLATTGLVVLIIAATLFVVHQMSYGDYLSSNFAQVFLIGGGVCLLVVGLVIALASLRDRGAGWMIALSIIGTLMAFPTLMAGIAGLNYDENHSGWPTATTEPTTFYDWTDGDQELIINGELALSEMPRSELPTIEIQDVTGELRILVRKHQPVEIQIVDMFGTLSADYVEPGPHWVPSHLGVAQDTTFRSIADETVPVPVVRIHNMLGTLHIVEVDLEESDFGPDVAPSYDSDTPSTQTPQSVTPAHTDAPQSSDRPQSTTTPASGQ